MIVNEKKRFTVENISYMMACYIKEIIKLDHISFLKCKLGIEIILINLSKGIIIYGLAFLLNCLFITLIFHLSYLVLRLNAYGIHAKKSSTCTYVSIILFIILPNILHNVSTSNIIKILMIFSTYISLYLYSPAGTKKNKINNLDMKLRLKIKSLVMYTILIIIFYFTRNFLWSDLIIYGAFLEGILILPITYKIFERDE